MKTILFGGHISRFGFAVIKSLLSHPFFAIDTLVLADYNRWNTFYQKLALDAEGINWQRKYRRQTKAVRQWLQENAPEVKVVMTSDANTTTSLDQLDDYKVVLSAAFPQIFSKAFLAATDDKAINFHPSYLPRCRGANPIYWTIASQEDYGGVTAHYLTERIDRGAIVAQVKILFEPTEITYEVLYEKVIAVLPALLEELAAFYKEQKESIAQHDLTATFFKENRDIHKKVYWEKEDFYKVSAKIRAGSAFTYSNNKKILLKHPFQFLNKTIFTSNNIDQLLAPGTLVHYDTEYLWIRLQEGYIKVKYLVPKKKYDLRRFFKKHIFRIGEVLQ